MATSGLFSELIHGTRWKALQRRYHEEKGDPLCGPGSLFFFLLAIVFAGISFLLFYLDGPDGLEEHFGNWKWLMFSLILFSSSFNTARIYSDSKKPGTAYWTGFLAYVTVFVCGMLVGTLVLDRFA